MIIKTNAIKLIKGQEKEQTIKQLGDSFIREEDNHIVYDYDGSEVKAYIACVGGNETIIQWIDNNGYITCFTDYDGSLIQEINYDDSEKEFKKQTASAFTPLEERLLRILEKE